MTTRRSFMGSLAAVPLVGVTSSLAASVSPTLLDLVSRYRDAVGAVDNHDCVGRISDPEFDDLVDNEIALARLIALTPARTLDEMAIKTAVALRETGLPMIKLGEPVNCAALMDIFDDKARPDIAELINMSIILDVVRLAGKAVQS